jgi:hypothetical protein
MNKVHYNKNKKNISGWRRAIPIVLAIFLLLPVAVKADIVIGTVKTAADDYVTIINILDVNINGSNRALVVAVLLNDNDDQRVSSVVIDPTGVNVPLTWLSNAAGDYEDDGYCVIYGVVNPPTGTFTVKVTASARIGDGEGLIAGAWPLTGVDQDSPFRTAVGTGGEGNSMNVTVTSDIGDIVLGASFVEGYNGGRWLEGSDTEDWDLEDGPLDNDVSVGQHKTGESISTTLNWTYDSYSEKWVAIAVAVKPAKTTIGDGTSPSNKDVEPDSTNNAVDAFTLSTNSTGTTDTVTALTVTFTGMAVADVAASGVKIYEDDGSTANEWDATDTQIGSAVSFSGTTASFTGLSISVNTTATQYLVTYDIASGATVSNTLQGAITAATVSNILVNNDTTDATLTVIAGADSTPDAFNFVDQTDVALSTVTESDIVEITGMDNGTAISIDGGGLYEYRICSDGTCTGDPAYISTETTIDSGQFVQLRLTSSDSYAVTTVATLTVGTANVDWSVSTPNCPPGSVCWDGGGGADPNWSNGLNWTGDAVPGTTAFVVFNGLSSNNATFNAADTIGSLTIEAGYTGTITMAADLLIDHTTDTVGFVQNGGTIDLGSTTWTHQYDWTYTAGTFTANTSTVVFAYTHIAMNSGTAVFNNVEISIGSTDFTVTGTMDVNGNLTISGARNIDTGTIKVAGNVTTTDASVGGTGTITFDGDGAQILGASGGTGALPGVNINKSGGGTLTIQDTIEIDGYLGSGWTYTTAGDVIAGTSTVVFDTNTSVDSGSMKFNNVILNNSTDLTVTGTMDVDGDLTITDFRNLIGGTITLAGNLTSTDNAIGTNNTGNITLDGANAQLIDLTTGALPHGLFTINKSAGTVTLASDMNLSATGQDLTLTSGCLDMAGFNLTINDTLTLESGATINQGGGTLSYTTLQNNGGTLDGPCPTSDNTPNTFNFVDQTDVALSTPTESDIVEVTGMDSGTAISIDGGGSYEYRICSDGSCTGDPAYTSTAGTIDSGQFVQLKLTSSDSYSTATVATLTVGTLDVDWSVTTVGDPSCVFSYRKEITIQSSQVIGSADHLNFPMLVSLSGDWLKTTTADSTNGRIENDPDGYDIIFKDSSGTQLDHEIEDYDGSVSGGTLIAWVRIPTLDFDDDTVIYMYYGNPCTSSSLENVTGVWDTNYKGVWHLDESPNDGVAGHIDSTSNPNDGTPNSFQTGEGSTNATGRIDGADNFDGVDDSISVSDHVSLDITTNITLSAWIYLTDSPGQYTKVLAKNKVTTYPYQFDFGGASDDKIRFQIGGVGDVYSLADIPQDEWVFIAATYDAQTQRLYINGVENNTRDDTDPIGTNDELFYIGGRTVEYHYTIPGFVDEVRVSDTPRLAGWIETEYNNQKENSTFYLEGDEDDLGDCSYSFYKPITIESDEVFGTSDHTDFPLLINISSDNDLRTKANNGDVENTDGYDIIFRDSSGRQLDHEIEKYEPSTGQFVAWVRIPTLSLSVDTVIYMYYGNSCISSSQEDIPGVWNTNYKAVWHLKESGNGTADEYSDSTSNPNHGQGAGETFESVILENSAHEDDQDPPWTLPFGFTATADRLLIAGIGTDKGSGGYTTPTGWTEIGSFTNSSVGHALYYKVAAGGETSVQFDWVDSGNGSAMWVGEYSGLTTTPLDKWTQANSGDTEVTSQTTGTTATTTQANEFIIASWGSDSGNTIELGRTYTNSFTEREMVWVDGGSGRPAVIIAERTVSSTGAYEATFNTTDSGDNLSGIIATFKIASSAGAPSQTPGRISNAQDFDGSSNYISIAAHSSLDLSTNFTVSAWFYKNTSGAQNLIYSAGTTNTQYWTIRSEENDKIEFNVDGASNWKSSTAIGTGAWHHMVVVKDGDAGTNMSFYVDGQPNGSATVGSVPTPTGQTRAIGYRPEGSDFYWGGILDEARVSSTPRSAGWIKTCYYNQKENSTLYIIGDETSYAPTAVDLISFAATGQDESVLVEWETAQEIDNLGFNLYRSSEANGSYTKLNSSLIPGLISSVKGRKYTHIDKDVTRDVLYYYMLEDVDLSGTRTMHGPVCVDWDGDGIPDDYDGQVDDDDSDDDTDDGPEVKIPELRLYEVDFGPEGWTPSSSYASWVKLSSFRARQGDEGIALEWETSFEVGNFGFHVYREVDGKFYRITPDLVPGSVFKVGAGRELPAGQSYMYWDGLTEGTGGELYWLDCVELNGGRASFGPIKPEIYGQPVSKRLKVRFKSITRHQVSRAREMGNIRELREELSTKSIQTQSSSAAFRMIDPENPSEPRLRPNEEQWLLAAQPAVKIYVKEDGWYRVGERELVAAGLSPGVDPRYLQLYADGEEKSMMVTGSDDGRFDPEDAVEFYGTDLDKKFSDVRVYWLVVGSRPGRRVDTPFIDIRLDLGKRMRIPRGLRGRGAPLSFPFPMQLKERTFYFAALKNGERENFFGSVISTEPVDQLLTVAHPDPSSPEDAMLRLVLQGATDSTHQIKIMFNYVEVGELVFSGQERETFEIQVPYDLLLEGDNIVTLTAQGGPMDVSLVDRVRMTYWRTYTADDDVLQFKAGGGEWHSIGGFSSSEIQVVDITDPMRMINIRGKVKTQDSGYAITVKVPSAGKRQLLAFTEETIKSPAGIEANLASSWHEVSQGADVIIIGHSDLLESVEFLKQLREQQGWSVVLVDVEDLYDEFNFGSKSPWALKDFLDRAYAYWNPRPRFVLLVGDASYDPRNYLGFGEFDLVPTKFVDTEHLTTASDDWFVDFNDDGLPEMAVGRLPVESAEEAAIVVSKIIAFEGVAGLMNEALLVADINDFIDFEGASADVADELLEVSVEVTEILRGRSVTARTDLLNLLNQGQLLVNYIGHGSTQIWNGNLLTSTDAWSLTNSPYLPFLVSMTCLNGFFQDPYSESMAETFLKAERGGAVAVWTSSGLTLPTEQTVMNLELIQLLFNGEGLTIGEAVMRAKRIVTNVDIRRTWILFGDPTLRLR